MRISRTLFITFGLDYFALRARATAYVTVVKYWKAFALRPFCPHLNMFTITPRAWIRRLLEYKGHIKGFSRAATREITRRTKPQYRFRIITQDPVDHYIMNKPFCCILASKMTDVGCGGNSVSFLIE